MNATSQNWDYIIVGGGSAGCLLANRLSANANVRVLLLEAGGSDWHPLFHWPAGLSRMTKGMASWGWQTVPQKHLRNRVLRFTQAKVIGGGSTINAQIYTRGVPADYDAWAQLIDDHGWSYEEVLPFFKRMEKNQRFANAYHDYRGELGVSNPVSALPICEAFFQAGQELGIPFNFDFNGANQEGLGYYQLCQWQARRSSSASAFLKPAQGRANLSVQLNAQVVRIAIEQGRAIGVHYATGKNTPTHFARCEAEVIVCAGAISSPKLLMHSGIGPADHLRDVGIAVVHDLPGVGLNLQDHIDLFVISECTGDHTYDRYIRPHYAAWAALQYLLLRKGPVASSLFETGGFWYTDSLNKARSPDIQLHLGLGTGIESGMAKLQNTGVTLNSAYLRPQSRGTVRLASADAAVAPLIDPNYWSETDDRKKSLAGLRLARDILRQGAMQRFVRREVLPGPTQVSDDDLIAYAVQHAKTDHHPVGTCRMGLAQDRHSVVGADLRVHGISALRVIDASVMPLIPSCNTNAPTYMVAEKGASMILATA